MVTSYSNSVHGHSLTGKAGKLEFLISVEILETLYFNSEQIFD